MARKLTQEQIAGYERDGYVCPVDDMGVAIPQCPTQSTNNVYRTEVAGYRFGNRFECRRMMRACRMVYAIAASSSTTAYEAVGTGA